MDMDSFVNFYKETSHSFQTTALIKSITARWHKRELYIQLLQVLDNLDDLNFYQFPISIIYYLSDQKILSAYFALALYEHASVKRENWLPELAVIYPQNANKKAAFYADIRQTRQSPYLNLCTIIEKGDIEALKHEMEASDNFNVNQPILHPTYGKTTLLEVAAICGQVETFRFLMVNQALFNNSVLKAACYGGVEEIIQRSIENGSSLGSQAIFGAIAGFQLNVFEWLNSLHPCKSKEMWNWAIGAQCYSILLSLKETSPIKLSDGLITTVKNCDADLLRWLFEYGVKIDQGGNYINTAAFNGSTDMIHLLVEFNCLGANKQDPFKVATTRKVIQTLTDLKFTQTRLPGMIKDPTEEDWIGKYFGRHA